MGLVNESFFCLIMFGYTDEYIKSIRVIILFSQIFIDIIINII